MLTYFYVYLRGFLAPLRDEKGAELAEYALLLALIAVVAIATLTGLGEQIAAIFAAVTEALAGVMPGG